MSSLKLPLFGSLIWTSWALGQNDDVVVRSPSRRQDVQAVEIPPSQYFEGNDGPWSTFDLRVGSNEQPLRVTVSTASPETFVVLSQYGCSAQVLGTVPDGCAVSRGNLFDPSASDSWQPIGDYGINQDGVGLEANLGYALNTSVGIDKLGIGLNGPTLDDQIVAGIPTPEPFYLGTFGLNSQPVNFSSVGNSTTPAFITTLKDQGLIPSISWSYTAGAIYRLKKVYGQLIFSGYDTSRFTPNDATFTMADDVTRDLVVVLQSISYSGDTSSVLLNDPIDIFIDSTDPYLWLPDDVCDAFEQAFGLTMDETSGLYLLDDTQRTELLNANPEVTFRLSDVDSGGEAVTVVLPYGAFDKTAQFPLVDNQSYYFPLKRAANDTQYTLGRTFLQEAYITADYERGTFNVSACAWNEGATENVVTITPAGSDSDSSGGGTPGDSSGTNSSKLGGGAIAGIVIGAIAGVLLIAGLIFFCVRRQRKKAAFKAPEPAPDMDIMTGPVHNLRTQASTRTGKHYSPETLGLSTQAGTSTNNGVSEAGTSQQELDAEETEVHPAAGHEAPQSPVYHELEGEAVPRSGTAEDDGGSHVDSPFVSTLGTAGWQEELDASSDLVSPTTPVHNNFRRSP